MHELLVALLILLVSALSPGPNNLMVMQRTLAGQRCAPTIAAILTGSLLLAFFAWTGVALVLDRQPGLQRVLSVISAAYLAWLGWRMGWCSAGDARPFQAHGGSATFIALALFQLVNPKGWAMMLAVSNSLSMTFSPWAALWILLAMVVPVSLACLNLWGKMGSLIREKLSTPRNFQWFSRVMGSLLIMSATAMLWSVPGYSGH